MDGHFLMFLFFVTSDRVHFRHSRGLTASAKHAVGEVWGWSPSSWYRGCRAIRRDGVGWAQLSEQNLVAGTACLSSENLDFESLQVRTFDFQTLHWHTHIYIYIIYILYIYIYIDHTHTHIYIYILTKITTGRTITGRPGPKADIRPVTAAHYKAAANSELGVCHLQTSLNIFDADWSNMIEHEHAYRITHTHIYILYN